MPRKLTTALLAPLFIALCGCSSVERIVRPQTIIPPSLLTCSDYPQTPNPEAASDVDIAVYMLRGEDAWRDCRDTLADVAALVAGESD